MGFGCSVRMSLVSAGSHFMGASLPKNSWSHISFWASQLTIYPLSTGLRKEISPKSLHFERSDATYVFLVLSRAMQFGTTVGSSIASAVTKPAFNVCAPLSMTSVRVGCGGGAGLDLRGAILIDMGDARYARCISNPSSFAASRMEGSVAVGSGQKEVGDRRQGSFGEAAQL